MERAQRALRSGCRPAPTDVRALADRLEAFELRGLAAAVEVSLSPYMRTLLLRDDRGGRGTPAVPVAACADVERVTILE